MVTVVYRAQRSLLVGVLAFVSASKVSAGLSLRGLVFACSVGD